MHHADKFIDRIIFLEGHPNLQTLDPLRIGETPKETLECDLAAELEAIALYKEARDYCEKVKRLRLEEPFRGAPRPTRRATRTTSRPSST